MKRIITLLLVLVTVICVSGCTIQVGNVSDSEVSKDACSVLDVNSVNEYINSGALSTSGRANPVAIVPITHINGPKDIDQFYMFVNFKYSSKRYIKYQVTYLSCTCRSANLNYWQTAYVELTIPDSGNPLDSKIKTLSFDWDTGSENERYLAGFWGDTGTSHSMPQTKVVYEKNENIVDDAGNKIPLNEQISIKDDYIPFFIGKDGNYIKSIAECSSEVVPVDNIKAEDFSSGEGRGNLTLDSFVGASVSTNNIILMLDALYDYHATDSKFN